MLTPEKQSTAKEKEKADTKRLARCGKCINCKSQVRRYTLRPQVSNAGIDGICGARSPRRPAWPHPTSPVTQSAASAAQNRARSALCLPASDLITSHRITLQDCGNCYNCADKPKFGGPGAHATSRVCSLPSAYAERASRPPAALAPNLTAVFRGTCDTLTLRNRASHRYSRTFGLSHARPPAHARRHQEAGMHQPQVLAHGAAR